MSDVELREWRASDGEAWLACQRASFGDERAKTPGEWRFLWEAGGLGTRGVVAVRGERVVASCIGTPTRTWFAGEERTCVHWVDLMVHPDHRRGLGGQRLHRQVARAFFDLYGGAGGDLLHHGWPIPPARRFGQRFLDYEFVREELCLVKELEPRLSSSRPPVTTLTGEDLPANGEALRWLWDRCAGEWGLATLRDNRWARWRFLEHPRVAYRLLAVREGDDLRGLAVVRETPWHWPGALALCDWLVPPGEEEVALHLDTAVQGVARELGLERVVTWIPPLSPNFDQFQERRWSVHPTPYHWLIRSFDQRVTGPWIHRHGWFTLADSDLA